MVRSTFASDGGTVVIAADADADLPNAADADAGGVTGSLSLMVRSTFASDGGTVVIAADADADLPNATNADAEGVTGPLSLMARSIFASDGGTAVIAAGADADLINAADADAGGGNGVLGVAGLLGVISSGCGWPSGWTGKCVGGGRGLTPALHVVGRSRKCILSLMSMVRA